MRSGYAAPLSDIDAYYNLCLSLNLPSRIDRKCHPFWKSCFIATSETLNIICNIDDQHLITRLTDLLLENFGDEITFFSYSSKFIKGKILLTFAILLKDSVLYFDRMLPLAEQKLCRICPDFEDRLRRLRTAFSQEESSSEEGSDDRAIQELVYHFYTCL